MSDFNIQPDKVHQASILPEDYQIRSEVVTDKAFLKHLEAEINPLSRQSPINAIPVQSVKTFVRSYTIKEIEKTILKKQLNLSSDPNFKPKGILESSGFSDLLGLNVWDSLLLQDPLNPGLLNPYLEIALVNVSQTRNIVTTAVQGLDGTIKEYISDGDFNINISATLVGDEADVYPSDSVNTLLNMFKSKNAIDIYSTVLNKYFGIKSIVITNYNFYQAEVGMRNVQNVDFTCISDNPDVYKIILQQV
jgi:hypothetical protein